MSAKPVELERVRLSESRVSIVDRQVVIERRDLAWILPEEYYPLWKAVSRGVTLQELVLSEARRQPFARTFSRVLRFLSDLVDRDLVADPKLIDLVNSARPPLQFATMIGFPSRDLMTVSERVGSPGSAASGTWSMAASWLLTLSYLTALLVTSLSRLGVEGPWPDLFDRTSHWVGWQQWLVLLFLQGIGIRSLGALFIYGSGAGLRWPRSLHLRIDPLGPHLFARVHLIQSDGALAVVGFFALSFLLFGSLASFLLPPELVIPNLILSGVLYLMIAHPDTQSVVTELWTSMVGLRGPARFSDTEIHRFEKARRDLRIVALLFGVVTIVAAIVEIRFSASILVVLAPLALAAASLFEGEHSQFNQFRRLWSSRRELEPSTIQLDRAHWGELPILRQLNESMREELLRHSELKLFRAGDLICRQGEQSRFLGILIRGEVAVIRRDPSRRPKKLAELSDGAVFGENGFFFGEARTADIRALSDGQWLMVRRPAHTQQDFTESSMSEEIRFRVRFLQALSGSDLLSSLPHEAFDDLLFQCQRQRLTNGEALFAEGAPADHVYFVVEGTLRVEQGGRLLGKFGPGNLLGEVAVMSPGRGRTGSAVAETACVLGRVTRESFWNLMSRRFLIGIEVERLAFRRLARDRARLSKEGVRSSVSA